MNRLQLAFTRTNGNGIVRAPLGELNLNSSTPMGMAFYRPRPEQFKEEGVL
jgi:hypothetical protein